MSCSDKELGALNFVQALIKLMELYSLQWNYKTVHKKIETEGNFKENLGNFRKLKETLGNFRKL